MTTRIPVGSAIRSFQARGASLRRARSVLSVRRPGSRGFTLIELMVVVAIITLLISIIIPSLAASRENVRSVLCRTNLTELSKALVMYAGANRGLLPYEDEVKESLLPAEIYNERKDYVCWYKAVDKYLKTDEKHTNLKLCPTVARDLPNSSESYRMNSKLAETNWLSSYYMKPPFRRIEAVKSPMTTVMLFDGDVGGDTISYKGRWRQTKDDVDYRHNVRTNLLFVGGNIDNLLKKVVGQRSVANSPIVWQQADLGPWNPDPVE